MPPGILCSDGNSGSLKRDSSYGSAHYRIVRYSCWNTPVVVVYCRHCGCCSSNNSCSRQTGTFISSRLLACLFSSNCTDGCTVLMCRLFVEPAAWDLNLQYSTLNFTAFPAVTPFLTFPACCLCSSLSHSLSKPRPSCSMQNTQTATHIM